MNRDYERGFNHGCVLGSVFSTLTVLILTAMFG